MHSKSQTENKLLSTLTHTLSSLRQDWSPHSGPHHTPPHTPEEHHIAISRQIPLHPARPFLIPTRPQTTLLSSGPKWDTPPQIATPQVTGP